MTDNSELNDYLAIADSNFLSKNIKIDRNGDKLSLSIIRLFEQYYNVKLPRLYVRFMSQHNGATIENNVFKYGDHTDSIYFSEFGDMISLMESIRYDNEHGYDTYPDLYIPFADDGGEGILFFDYSKEPNTTEPRIVMISEGNEEFVANSFEDFVKSLSVDRNSLEDQLNQIEKELNLQLPEKYKEFCIEYCTSNFNKRFCYKYYKLEFIFPDKILWSVCDWNKNHFENIIPFAADNDDLFCFDHTKIRNGKIPIVFCNSKSVLNMQVIANSFEEFINMLHEPED